VDQNNAIAVKALIFQVHKLISRRHPDTDSALGLLQPYLIIDEINGLTDTQSAIGLHFLCSLAGDCYRIMGDVQKAVYYYYRALQFLPGGACSDYYVELVVDNKISEHYQNAYDNMLQNEENHKQMSLLCHIKAVLFLTKAILRRPCLFFERRVGKKRTKVLKAELISLLGIEE
jgi:tetratricopeptide (TPR) repeat protein